MEEFLKIDWHPSLDDLIDEVFVNEKRLKEESAMYKIMQGIFTDPFTEFESDDGGGDDDNEEDDDNEGDRNDKIDDNGTNDNKSGFQKPQCHIPGLIKLPFKLPRLSSLTREQHAICLKVLLRFSGSEKPEINHKNRSELELYMKLCPTIREEQEEFLNLAKTHWNSSNLKLIETEYIEKRWRSKVEKLKKLPRYYTAAANVPFKAENTISLTKEATLLEMGQLPRVIIPGSNKKRNIIYCDVNKLDLLYPAWNDSSSEKCVVSEDPNCERLAECGETDVVISSGGLNCLANNFPPNYNNSWILPVVVKENSEGNIIYIDKPLPPTAMTIPQKNAWIFKYILKSQLLNPNHYTSISLTDHDTQKSADDGLFGDLHSDDLLKLEEENEQFQSLGPKKSSKESKSNEKLIPSKDQSTTNQTKTSDDLPTMEFEKEIDSSVHNKDISEDLLQNSFNGNKICSINETSLETRETSVEFRVPEDIESSSDLKKTDGVDEDDKVDVVDEEMPEKEPRSRGYRPEINVLPIYQRGRTNVAYNIFSLGPSGNSNDDSSKTNVQTYNMLVRTKIDGVEKLDKDTLHPVMLVPKLEHQVALGAEAVTAEEALKQWTTLTYRPNTSIVRIRIAAHNSEVIQIERRTPMSINNESKRLYGLNVDDSFVILHNVIHHLKALKPGKYLLRHTPTNGPFATIYQEATSSGKNVFDLHEYYSQQSLQTICNTPWPAIDKGVVTPMQKCFERMPAMYHPARGDTNITSKVTRGRGRGGLRGRVFRAGSQGSGRGGATGRNLGGLQRVRTKKAKKKNRGRKIDQMEKS